MKDRKWPRTGRLFRLGGKGTAMKNLQNYLFELCGEYLPSGFERDAAGVQELLAPLVDECFTDRAGNIIGHRMPYHRKTWDEPAGHAAVFCR